VSNDMMTIELSNRSNKINWKPSAIRISLKSAHDHMFPQDTAEIHVMPGKFTGPYQVRVNKKLGEALVEDGEVDIFSIESDAEGEQMVFNVYQVDDQGRRVGVEVTSRVLAARITRKRERDMDERSRTVRFFIQGTPELLALMGDPVILNNAINIVRDKILHSATSIERHNITQVEDELGQKLCSWILFVVLDEGGAVAKV